MTSSPAFENDCRQILSSVFEALVDNAERIQGVEGSDQDLAGISGRAERHFQAVAFCALSRTNRVTVEDQYHNPNAGGNVQTADLAIELRDGRWMWIEIKRFRPDDVSFSSVPQLRGDITKLSDLGRLDDGNLPHGILFAFVRDDASRKDQLEAVWEKRVAELLDGSWTFREYRIGKVRFSEDRTGELLVGLWARETVAR